MTKIGSNIKKIRTTKNLSQQAFAELFELNRSNIASYEENRAEPKIESILKVANYFSIPVSNLLLKDLTVNEILQFNADKLLENNQNVVELKLREVPFISEDILAKGHHRELNFLEMDTFPLLKIPDTSNQVLMSVQFNDNITHHQIFETYTNDIVMYFRAVTSENIHLLEDKKGLLVEEHKLLLGIFQTDIDGCTFLHLSDSHKDKVDPTTNKFWKLFAHYSLG